MNNSIDLLYQSRISVILHFFKKSSKFGKFTNIHYLFVIIEYSVHVLNPDSIYWSIKYTPFPAVRCARSMFSECISQYTIRPFVWDRVKSAIQLTHRDWLGVDDAILNLSFKQRDEMCNHCTLYRIFKHIWCYWVAKLALKFLLYWARRKVSLKDVHSKMLLTNLFMIIMAPLEMPVSGWTLVVTK